MLVELFVTAAVIALISTWYFARRNDVFKRMGVTGPKPMLLFGNLKDLFGESKVPLLQVQRWTKEYGSTYGFYEGGLPVMVISDPDIVQEMLVKQFHNFDGRKEFAIQPNPDSGNDRVHMFMARGPQWKRLRVISNPTFTSAKIKQMLPKIHDCIDEMMNVLSRKHTEGKPFDIYGVYQGLTLDVIARVAFAYESSVQKEPDSELLKWCNSVFRRPPTLILLLAQLFPAIRRSIYYFVRLRGKLITNDFLSLRQRVEKIIELKRKQQASGIQGTVDFIQLLLDAEADPNEEGADFKNGSSLGLTKDMTVQKKLTAGEIASQSFLFILAGYETTSTALGFTTYLLATNSKAQEQLIEEIDAQIGSVEEINYDSVQKLPYLECVIQEALRMYPLAGPAVTRHTRQPCTIKGVHFPAGMDVMVDVWSLHYNEDLWGPDVNEFKPDRFSSKIPHPYAYIPFGAGPRICIGMRFAQLEMKIALCTILKRYRILQTSETEKPLEIRSTFVTLAPKNGIRVKLEERK